MQGLIGRKIGMTRFFDKESGRDIPITVIQAENNVVHQVKTTARDGYNAIQLGFGPVGEGKLNRPLLGHCKKHGKVPTRVIREFSPDAGEQITSGQKIGVDIFDNVKYVDVTGVIKGRGYTGTIKRHNFKRGRETHGNTNHREPGSSGQNTYPGRVFPGLRMAGHYGASRQTMRGLAVISIEKEAGLIFVKGSIPGANRGIVLVKKAAVHGC